MKPYHAAVEGTHQSLTAVKLLSDRLYFKKELTRVWQLDSWYQPGWAGGREPYDGAAA
jgi:hypothetical protein